VIDFGLGAISHDVEDKGTDIVMMKKALGERGEAFAAAYARAGGKPAVLKMSREIEKRGRYMERG
jgi:tRNA A-37 threonylcarbamoyl transferase component Bud32